MFYSEKFGEITTSLDGKSCWILPNFFASYTYKSIKGAIVFSPSFFCHLRSWRLLMIANDRGGYRYIGLFIRTSYPISSKCHIRLGVYNHKLGVSHWCNGELDSGGFGKWDFLNLDSTSSYLDDISPNGFLKVSCEIQLIEEEEEVLDGISLPTASAEENENEEVVSVDTSEIVSEVKGARRLALDLEKLFLDETSSDALLKVEDREFPVHRAILIARSPVFASMFQHDTAERTSGIVDIPDCKASAFDVFLRYLYTGNADTMSMDNVFNLYYAADKYQVNELKEECVEYMKTNLSVDTFCTVMTLSLNHSESDLKKAAIRFFCEHAPRIIITLQWQNYLRESPTQANELFVRLTNAERE